MIQQVSVFIENRPGRLAEILGYLAGEGIGLRAYSFAETSDFGIMRIVAQDAKAAMAALRRGGYTAKATDILGILVSDETGSSVEAFTLLGEAGINIEYTYAFSTAPGESALVLLRVDDNAKAAALLTRAGIHLAEHAELF